MDRIEQKIEQFTKDKKKFGKVTLFLYVCPGPNEETVASELILNGRIQTSGVGTPVTTSTRCLREYLLLPDGQRICGQNSGEHSNAVFSLCFFLPVLLFSFCWIFVKAMINCALLGLMLLKWIVHNFSIFVWSPQRSRTS